ncbi:unnamed protein product (macronuclear) [Paramecium tetraurelia]|uniref:RAP domain-containing protein n=1 Tax=Paramecium tetraurelia TaxID=5888 RepID=A0EFZ2_PARTE|nr:uncharacterized protein GSPATT00026556001 [Paramecium tetraurelia]CAK94233.1 unnamed protein product [Paramecium tetraurelia]|eukprot:XP_001461606.1 hypothetical protein (macronuclear) [Paramecium tetraurelia strain d4-2]
MNSQFLASKAYLMKKFSIPTEQQLYFYLGKKFKFPICNKTDMIHYIYFLSLSHQRKAFGDSAKFRVIELLNQKNNFLNSMNIEQQIALLAGLSNLLIYDETLLESICKVIQSNLASINLRERLIILHSLQKLRMENHPIFALISDQLNNQFEFMDHYDQIIHLLIQTRLYHDNIVSSQIIEDLLKKFMDQKNEVIQNYFASFNSHYCQLMFNIFPEIIGQNYQDAKPSEQNQFYPHFQKLERIYKIARRVIDKRTGYKKADYYEYQNVNFLNIPIEKNQDILTKLENNVLNVLKTLNIQFNSQERILIYDVDFFLPNNTIINCNGPLHFIMNPQLQHIGHSPNHQTVLRYQ